MRREGSSRCHGADASAPLAPRNIVITDVLLETYFTSKNRATRSRSIDNRGWTGRQVGNNQFIEKQYTEKE